MFYKDTDNRNIIRFGAGDIEIAAGILDDPTTTIGVLCLIPQEPAPIGTTRQANTTQRANCLEADGCTHTRLEFTNTASLDNVLLKLQECRNIMQRDTNF
jgi:hypothetical protein